MISTISYDFRYELFTGPENEFRILFPQIFTNLSEEKLTNIETNKHVKIHHDKFTHQIEAIL